MSNTIATPNMGLNLPIPGVDPGPDYALNINASFGTLDSHNHSNGQGVQINPSGLNINSDLSFISNNAINLRTARFVSQSSTLSLATDLDCLYVVGVDLYYNDGSGNKVRITQSGGVAGSPGSISNLSSPASASYVSANSTFVWQSATSTSANLDAASVILRNLSASSYGLTLSPPTLTSNYTLTLPLVPSSQSFLAVDTSGNITNYAPVANGITRNNLAAVGQQVSASSGNFFTSSTSLVSVTNLSVTITTSGRPVMIMLIPDNSISNSSIYSLSSSGSTISFLNISGTSGLNSNFRLYSEALGATTIEITYPPGSFNTFDAPSAGTYTYTVSVMSSASTSSITYVSYVKLVAYEL